MKVLVCASVPFSACPFCHAGHSTLGDFLQVKTRQYCNSRLVLLNFSVHLNHLGLLLQSRFWFSWFRVGPEILHFP